jgi:8-oxo-dGTP diphosphatase
LAKQINVVGAVVTKDGLVLCAQRGPDGNLPGYWEFPGGKVEKGESMQEALQREIQEELACTIHVGSQVTKTIYEYDFGVVSLTTFYSTLTSGTPQASEHSALAWLEPLDLNTLQWAPADVPAILQIQKDLC